jgi:hypothetical protein
VEKSTRVTESSWATASARKKATAATDFILENRLVEGMRR